MTESAFFDSIRRTKGPIQELWQQNLTLEVPFVGLARQFAALPGTVLLMSGGGNDCSRYHILGVEPWLTISTKGREIICRVEDKTFCSNQNPFVFLKWVLETYGLDSGIPDSAIPMRSGLMGYFSYDLKDMTECLPRTTIDDQDLPHLWLASHRQLIVHDRQTRETHLVQPVWDDTSQVRLTEQKRFVEEQISSAHSDQESSLPSCRPLRSNFTQDQYQTAVKAIKEYIRAGDVYQVNLSQRFEADFEGNPFDLFAYYHRINPAPFYAYVETGTHKVISTSPERFLQLRGQEVETRPIKGTRPRDPDPIKDEQFRRELTQSPKDDAELSMIVDLLRNDIGKVCQAGTVEVSQHKRLEAYENVYHLVSDVKGLLEPGRTAVDLLEACFPGGSITGCPKIRAMEIIDELESHRRHVYTGSLGYISFHQTMDLSIAIRTATVLNKRIYFSVGGGIVYDSDPEDEYLETLHKGRTLIRGLQAAGEADPSTPQVTVWMDGRYLPQNEAKVNFMSPGVQYGHGFFETLRADQGHIFRLEAHLKRFRKAWQALFESPCCDVTWSAVIRHLLATNGLEDQTAAIKLMALMGTARPHLMVSVRPYQHRLTILGQASLRLGIYPHPRFSPLADFKSVNYLYYDQARRWASTSGFDEALILNPDGSVSECNTANILAISGKQVLQPASEHVLKGVMEETVLSQLQDLGFARITRPLFPEDLKRSDHLLVTNSLMGCVPVHQMDEWELSPAIALCQKINRRIWAS